jgi:prepilin-type N-terminal cleavage/methylation domain-containing protein
VVRPGSRRDAGMTLVEIMVTLIISSIIAASTFMFFAGQQRIYETQTKLLNVQQNLWAAMEVVARYARAAGTGMYQCVRPANYANAAAQDGSRLLNTSPSPGPLTANLATIPQTGLRAFNKYTGNMQWIPPLWIVNQSAGEGTLNVRPNTDILTVAFGNRASGTDFDARLASTFSQTDQLIILEDGTSDMFRPWEFVLLLVTPAWSYGQPPTSDRGCSLFQITGIPQAMPKNTLEHAGATAAPAPPGSIPWNPNGDLPAMLPAGGYVAGSTAGVRNFGSLTWVSFFIQQVGGGVPNLMMRQWHLEDTVTQTPVTQILAEGIEELQVSFACDTGTLVAHNLLTLNGQLDEGSTDATRRTDEWWNNVPGDILPTPDNQGFCNLPTAVRITMVARTLGPDDLIDAVATGNGPLDVEDHVYPAPPSRPRDQFRRRVLATTVFPRNNKPL